MGTPTITPLLAKSPINMVAGMIKKLVVNFPNTAAAETIETTFNIVGKLLRFTFIGGDGASVLLLKDESGAVIFTKAALAATIVSEPIVMTDGTNIFDKVPIAGKLTIETADAGTGVPIEAVIYYEENID